MLRWGISRQLAHRYVQSGWLEPLGYGYFLRPGDTLTLTGAVAALEAQGVAVQIMEPLYTLRHDVLQSLLEACTRIKVKRLFFTLADDLKLPILQQLDLSRMDFGADSVYVRTKKGSSLILKHPGMAKHG